MIKIVQLQMNRTFTKNLNRKKAIKLLNSHKWKNNRRLRTSTSPRKTKVNSRKRPKIKTLQENKKRLYHQIKSKLKGEEFDRWTKTRPNQSSRKK